MGWERGKAGAGESQFEFCRTQPRHDGRVGWQNAGESTSLGEPPEVEPAARHRHCPWWGWKKSNGTGWTALPRMAVPCMPVSIPSLVGLGFRIYLADPPLIPESGGDAAYTSCLFWFRPPPALPGPITAA